MIKPKINGRKVVFGPCRLSYTHLFKKYAPDGDPEDCKYQTGVLIPKNETETVKALQAAIEAAKTEGELKSGGKKLKNWTNPLRDGDEDKPDDPAYTDQFFINAKCNTRPGICDRFKNPITDEEEIYSGVWAYVSVTFYWYDRNGNKGVACGLNNVMKFKDDDPFGGRVSADADFADIEDDDDDM